MDHRRIFLTTATTARNLIARPEVADRWANPSALAEMTVGDVAAHLARAVSTVDTYLGEQPGEDAERVDAVGYFLALDGLGDDLGSELNVAVRRRAVEGANDGHGSVVAMVDGALGRLSENLHGVRGDQPVAVLGGRAISLNDYLVTRLIELTVHIDDLVESVDGLETPPLNELAFRISIAALVDIARRRHGDMAVLRALTRRERDHGEALRVL